MQNTVCAMMIDIRPSWNPMRAKKLRRSHGGGNFRHDQRQRNQPQTGSTLALEFTAVLRHGDCCNRRQGCGEDRCKELQ